jgi:3'-phosphoadenosine 5'-phosphosulfate sulfotransferase (PAPS reductase)/FAD synthetase
MFLDINCVEAARQRVRHVFETFDDVWVQFSGGKDSTAALYLVKEYHDEHGLGPVNCIFRDEEMVSPATIKFVEEVSNYDWVNMEWYCLPYGQEVWVLGRRAYIVLWSEQRRQRDELIREIPEGAITAESFGLPPGQSLSQPVDHYTMQGKKGSVAFITGVRANESMIRYRSCVQKLHENYIVKPHGLKKSMPLHFAKVIYDWTTDDVLKFITEEHGATYCEYYDLAAVSGANTRVGIPLHSVAIRRINDVIVTEPEFYDRLWECFPQIDAQRRWWPDFDIEKLIDFYASYGWDGVSACIEENVLTPGLRKMARKYAAAFRKKQANDPFAYPVEWLVRNILINSFATTDVTPVGPKTKAHALRIAAAQAEEELNALDKIDDNV